MLQGYAGTIQDAQRELEEQVGDNETGLVQRMDSVQLTGADAEEDANADAELHGPHAEGEEGSMSQSQYRRVKVCLQDAVGVSQAMLRGLQREDDVVDLQLVELWESASFHVKALAEVCCVDTIVVLVLCIGLCRRVLLRHLIGGCSTTLPTYQPRRVMIWSLQLTLWRTRSWRVPWRLLTIV